MQEPTIIIHLICECGAHIGSGTAPLTIGDNLYCPKRQLHLPSNGWSWTIEAHVAATTTIPLPTGD